jgi:hypothetical protein
MAELLTTKKLAKQVNDQILNVLDYYQGDVITDRDANSMTLNSLLNQTANSNQIIESVIKSLELLVPNHISWGLDVKAMQPEPNHYITITKGQGVANANVFRIDADISVPVPLETNTEIYYVVLYAGTIQFLSEETTEALTLAKIVNPSRFATRVVDRVTVSEYNDSTDAYIQSFKPVNLYQDWLGNFEEDSITLLRNNISEVLADNIVGNIRLSENLKIINTQNTLELDSKSLKLFDSNVKVAEFNRKGSYFYNNAGNELARFTTTDARIGNMLLTGNSIQSADYISNIRGFKIDSVGFAEFEDVKVRGRISSSVFEYDKISAVGGQLLVANASVLSQDINDVETIIYVDDNVFGVGDFIRLKVAEKDEWIKILSEISGGNGYFVQRGINGYSENWTKGTAVYSTGKDSEGGLINLNAYDSYSPYIDVIQRYGDDSYLQLELKARLGNLNGITDPLYGQLSGFGLYSENVYLKGKLYAPDIKTNIDGARVELDSNGLRGYDDDENEVMTFNLSNISGISTPGDFFIGNESTENYLKWNNSTGTLTLRGDIAVFGGGGLGSSDLATNIVFFNDDGISWTSGDLIFSNGDSYAIEAGHIDYLYDILYIYFDKNYSLTELTYTYDINSCVGDDKCLLAIIEPISLSSVDEYVINAVKGSGTFISGDSIRTGSIDAIRLSVNQLSAISSDIGDITAGSIVGATIKTATSGSRVELSSSGILALDSSNNEILNVSTDGDSVGDLVIGNGSSYAKWDNSEQQFSIAGNIDAQSGSFTGNVGVGGSNLEISGVDKAIRVYSDTVTIDSTNNKLNWSENGSTKAATLTAGNYTPTDLASHVQTLMRASGNANTNVTYDDNRFLTISNSSLSTLSLLFYSGSNKAYTCGKALGFDISSDKTGALTYTSRWHIALRVELGSLL